MGWTTGGTRVMKAVIDAVKDRIENDTARMEVYADLMDTLEDMDWDSPMDCLGEDPAYDKLYKDRYGEDE